VNLADEIAQHGLGYLEIGDNPVAHRSNGDDVAGGLAQHVACILPYGQNPILGAVVGADRHHGRFVEDDAFALHVDQRVRCTQIDRQIVGKNPQNTVE